MVGEQLAIVHFVDVITTQDQHVIRIITSKYIDILIHGSAVPGTGFFDPL